MLRAFDMMNRNIAKIRESATVAEAVHLMKQRNCRSLIVDRRNDDDSYGIVTETDVIYKVVSLGKDPETISVATIMTKPCIVAEPDATLEEVAQLFSDYKLLRVPVVQDKVLGIITVSDLLSHHSSIMQPYLEDELKLILQRAYQLCTEQGAQSAACAAGWNGVETLQSELTHHQVGRLLKQTFEESCEEFPEGSDSEFYANLCSG